MRSSFITILFLALSSCSLIHPYRTELRQAENVMEENPDSAYKILEGISPKELSGDDDIALYGLLYTEALYRCYLPTTNDSIIDFSIRHFCRKKDTQRLSRSYFYKGITIYDSNRHDEALACIKKAELLAASLNDNALNHKIYEGLVMVNHQAKCFELMLKYSRLSLECSRHDGRPLWMAFSLIHMANSYCYLQEDDSARIYADMIIPLLDSLPESQKGFFYSGIGCVYHAVGDDAAAKRMLLESVRIKPRHMTYNVLGDIYHAEGKNDKAEEIWKKALCSADTAMLISVYGSMIDFYEKQGRLAEALAAARKKIQLNDEMIKRREKTKIAEMQLKYDNEVVKRKMYAKLTLLLSVVLVLLVTFFIFIYYHRSKVRTFHSKIYAAYSLIHNYEKQIRELEDSGRDVADEVAKLRRKIDMLNKSAAERLAHGEMLHEEIDAGGNMIRWNFDDISDFIDYYKVYNSKKMAEWEKEYNHPTQGQIVYLILADKGFGRDDLARIQNISTSSLRSIRARLNGRKDKKK